MKKHRVRLNEAERQELGQFIRTGQRSARALTRARILEWSDEAGSARKDADIARDLGIHVHTHTVEKTRSRYVLEGLQAVLERKTRKDKGIPVKVDGRVEAQITALACSQTPNDKPQWTLKMLSDRMVELGFVDSISRETVRKTLKKMNSSHT